MCIKTFECPTEWHDRKYRLYVIPLLRSLLICSGDSGADWLRHIHLHSVQCTHMHAIVELVLVHLLSVQCTHMLAIVELVLVGADR